MDLNAWESDVAFAKCKYTLNETVNLCTYLMGTSLKSPDPETLKLLLTRRSRCDDVTRRSRRDDVTLRRDVDFERAVGGNRGDLAGLLRLYRDL